MSVAAIAEASNLASAVGGVSRGQHAPGASGADLFAATQSISKGGMRGVGLVAAMIAEVVLKQKAIEIAEDYYKTNKREYDWFIGTHSPIMAQSANEAVAGKTYAADNYASVPAGVAKSAVLDRQWFEARRRIPKYNVGQFRRLDYDMAVARSMAVTAGWNIAVRYEQEWADQHNARTFKRKIEMAQLGVELGNQVRDGLSRASSNLASAYDNIGDTIASIGNGYAAKSGYEDGRKYAQSQYAAANKRPAGMVEYRK